MNVLKNGKGILAFALVATLFTVPAMGRGGNDHHGGGRNNDRNDHHGGGRDNDRNDRRDNDRRDNDRPHHNGEKTRSDYIREGYRAGFRDGTDGTHKREKDLRGEDHQRWFDQGYRNGRESGSTERRRDSYDRNYPYYYNGGYYSRPSWYSGYGSPYHDSGYDVPDYGYSSPSTGTPSAGGVSCAPATMNKNTFAAEAVLAGLAENELADAVVFNQRVDELSKMEGKARIEEGFRIIGVKNPQDSKEVLEVVYAREPSAASISRVSDSLKITSGQAKLVITAVTNALKAQ